jgi:hypothetical protein
MHWDATSQSNSQEISPFMGPEISLPCSQEPFTDPYSETSESNTHPPTPFPYDPF